MSTGFWTLDRIADALASQSTGSLPRGSAHVHGITTDTRTVGKGDVFLALEGERFDAHDYLRDAVRDGAAALVVSQAPKVATLGVPVYVVSDTLVALGALASYWRRAWGKTSSASRHQRKDEHEGAAEGVPRASLHRPRDDRQSQQPHRRSAHAAFAAAGSRRRRDRAGHESARRGRDPARHREPDIAVVTSIAEEHLEGLGDLAGVLREEAAVYEGVPVGIAPSSQPEVAEAARGKASGLSSPASIERGDEAGRWEIGQDGRA